VRCSGTDFLSLSADARARKINYIGAELLAEFPLTAFEAALMGRSVAGSGIFSAASDEDRTHVEEAMHLCACWELAHRDLRELSGGERQLVAVARALAQGAKILFLDEGLSRMDLHHQARMGELLQRLCREKGYTVLLVSHDWNLATEWATRCILLKSGKILKQGIPAEVLTSQSLEELYPGAPVWVGPHPSHGGPRIYFGSQPRS
jgi:iron complex transport system ATP-binding protein